MINKVASITVWVADQDRALEFYVHKLGFEKRDDRMHGNYRWLTVSPPGSGTKINLGKAPSPSQSGSTTAVVFSVEDVWETYEELVRRGVQFSYPPQLTPWGDTIGQFTDGEGNTLALTQDANP